MIDTCAIAPDLEGIASQGFYRSIRLAPDAHTAQVDVEAHAYAPAPAPALLYVGGVLTSQGSESCMHDRLFPSDIPDLPPANPDPLEALQAAAVAFVERIEGHLEEDCREGELDDHVPPSGAANDTCTRLAREIASIVAAAPRMKSAAFSEEPGGVSLVLQSLASKRRTNFRISADGWPIEATHVDEHMRVGTRRISANDVLAVRELTEWLTQ